MPTDGQEWEARSRAFALLGRLVADGPRGLRPALQATGLTGFPEDDDAADADHHRWTRHEILPWESVHLTADRLLGGPRSEAAAAFAVGLPLARSEPDHLGRELAIVGWYCGAIADAARDRRPEEAERVGRRLESFLSDHLAAWVGFPAHAAAGVAGWGAALSLAEELVADLLAERGIRARLPDPSARDPLGPAAGLRDVADWLATPLETGVAWTHAALRDAGAGAGVPIGFGTRTDELESLLRNAAELDRLPAALARIDVELDRWERAWGGSAWRERVAGARATLSRLGEARAPRGTP
jgi:hypothetical protein